MARRKGPNAQTLRLAKLIAAVLEEPYDNPADPGEVRLEQARTLLTQWSSAQGSLIGAVAEILNIKQGNCVRCAELPCPKCGRQEYRDNGLVNV